MISLKIRLIREYNRLYRYMLRWLWNIQGRDAARAYMFHSVLDTPEQIYSQFAITKESFEQFIIHELSRGQIPMDAKLLSKAVDAPRNYKNHFVVTFDDIYDSVYTNAYPILKAHNVPFVLFITPYLIDKVDPNSRNAMVTMEHLREMAADPLCIIAAHGMEHRAFRNYTEIEARESMLNAKQWLTKEFGKNVDFFAFPYGRRVEVSNQNIRTLSTCGYHCGFSALDGSLLQQWFSGRWYLPRILVDDIYVQKALKKSND